MAYDFSDEIQRRIATAAMGLATEMREKGIPDDWWIDLAIDPATPHDLANNEVRIIAIPHPPFNRWID